MYTLAIFLYAFAVRLIAPFHRKARLMCAGRRQTYRILREQIDQNASYLWFHASSLGEFEQGRPLIEAIRKQYPHYKILLTFFSPSGYEVRKDYPGADVVCYLPFDTPRAIRKFIRLAKPCKAVFIKYEFWANCLGELKKRRIPTYLVSAIFRPEQVFFRWYGKSYRQVLTCFDHLYVQDDASRDLLARYGIRNVSVTGDTRFDRVVDEQRAARPIPLAGRFAGNEKEAKPFLLIAGSTWPQDEAFLLPYFNSHPEIKLILAPHEVTPSRLSEIEAQLTRPAVRLSEADESTINQKECLIIDCFGLLSSIYRYGDAAYIGGGFGKGIHNVPEAAVYGIPVVFGPSFHKFKEARDILACGGGFSVSSPGAFRQKMDELLADPGLRQAAGQAAGAFVAEQAGAAAKIVKGITENSNIDF